MYAHFDVAVTVPLGYQSDDTKANAVEGQEDAPLDQAPGLPFGLMFVGARFSEAKLIALAYAYEQATHVRLKRKAYDKATPKTQLVDVIGKVKHDPKPDDHNGNNGVTMLAPTGGLYASLVVFSFWTAFAAFF